MESNFLWCAHTHVTVFPRQLELILGGLSATWQSQFLGWGWQEIQHGKHGLCETSSRSLYLSVTCTLGIKHTTFNYQKVFSVEILSAALDPVSDAAQEPRLQVVITASCYLKTDKHILTNCRRQTCGELKSPTPPVLPMHCLSQHTAWKRSFKSSLLVLNWETTPALAA